MDATKVQTIRKFIGINNVDDAVRLEPKVVDREYLVPLLQANNVDIDNSYSLSSRSPYTTVKAGTDIHSLWSDGNVCFYADSGSLLKLDSLYNTKTLRTGMQLGARISYAPWNERYYYTNRCQIGYVMYDTAYNLSDPDIRYKLPLPAGQLIEYYKGCLYVAKDDCLYISDPLCDYYDIRDGYKRMKGDISLLRAVDTGIYIGDDVVRFMNGKGGDDFEIEEVYPHRPVMFTDIRQSGRDIGGGVVGNVALFTCDNGICVGTNTGLVENLTEEQYLFTSTGEGAAFIKNTNDVHHYINSLY
jgi:hypothetical protein